MENKTSNRHGIDKSIVCSYFSSRNSTEVFYGEMKNYCDSGIYVELRAQFKEGTVLLVRTRKIQKKLSTTKIADGCRSISLAQVKWSKPICVNGAIRFATGLKHLVA